MTRRNSGIFDLPEDEPEVVKLLVQYLYEGEYDPALPLEGEKGTNFNCLKCNVIPLPALNGEPKQLLNHAKMYEIGDKYDVVGLKDLAREKFSRSCKHFWDDPIFAVAANHAFSTTVEEDTGLRSLVSSTVAEHMELVEKPEIAQLMAQFNGLAMSILQAGVKEQRWGKKK
ncbi:hypothetical protein N0V94_004976 [Neodidymelliopsis sp. IMI 364377]|nr:hypothetical protein N0V94_004976 [Neodidymelliopsis sp. IMI 364377]